VSLAPVNLINTFVKMQAKKELSSPFLHVVGANAEIRALDRQEELKNGYLDQ